MERVNDDMQTIRDVAEQVGVSFPDAENAPPCSGVHVPRNGRDIRDSLQYAGYQGIFPVPDLSMFTEELSMGSAQALILGNQTELEALLLRTMRTVLHICPPKSHSTHCQTPQERLLDH